MGVDTDTALAYINFAFDFYENDLLPKIEEISGHLIYDGVKKDSITKPVNENTKQLENEPSKKNDEPVENSNSANEANIITWLSKIWKALLDFFRA